MLVIYSYKIGFSVIPFYFCLAILKLYYFTNIICGMKGFVLVTLNGFHYMNIAKSRQEARKVIIGIAINIRRFE